MLEKELINRNKEDKNKLSDQIYTLDKIKKETIENYTINLLKDVITYKNIGFSVKDKNVHIEDAIFHVDFDEDNNGILVLSKKNSYKEFEIKDWHYNWIGFKEVIVIVENHVLNYNNKG